MLCSKSIDHDKGIFSIPTRKSLLSLQEVTCIYLNYQFQTVKTRRIWKFQKNTGNLNFWEVFAKCYAARVRAFSKGHCQYSHQKLPTSDIFIWNHTGKKFDNTGKTQGIWKWRVGTMMLSSLDFIVNPSQVLYSRGIIIKASLPTLSGKHSIKNTRRLLERIRYIVIE